MSISLPPLMSSRTDAINALLRSIGEAPISSADLSQSVDVAAADGALRDATSDVLGRGWHFNREYDLPLAPSVDTGEIALPINCHSVCLAYWEGYQGTPVAITERARKLYDTANHTFVFDKTVMVDLILLLEWEEMPEYARRYITLKAAEQFQAQIQGSRIVQAVQEKDVMAALATLEQREDAANPQNQITANRETLYRIYGRLLRRRN